MRVIAASVASCLVTAHGVATCADELGKETFRARCNACHASGQMGYTYLFRKAGRDNALIEERKGFPAEYIRYVVREGRGNMPPLTRVEVTDSELEQIVAYLTRAQQES